MAHHHVPSRQRRDTVYAGMSVRVGTSGPVGKLGLLVVQGPENRICGITAAHLADVRSELLSQETSCVVGVRKAAHSAAERLRVFRPIDAALALVEINSAALISEGEPCGGQTPRTVDPADVFGHAVIRSGATRAAAGRLTGLACPIHLIETQSHSLCSYYGALEVTWRDESEPFGQMGDSGAAVTTEQGDLLGLIIGGTHDRCLVAPLYSFMAANGLRFCDSPSIAAHNTRAVLQERAVGVSADAPLPTATSSWPVVTNFGKSVKSESDVFARASRRVA
jgi:hypothetical protein